MASTYKITSTDNIIVASKEFMDKNYPNDYIEIVKLPHTVTFDFPTIKAQKLQALKQWHDSQIEAMKAKYSQAEIDSFLDKRNEAMAWRVNNTAPTPYIDAMSGGVASVKTMLINAILAKVDATAQLEALVLSKRDAIELSTTQTELDAITW